MSDVTVDVRVDLVADGGVEELDEAAVAARIEVGDADLLHQARALDGRLRIGDVEIFDELVPVVHRICFNAVIVLLADDAEVDYPYSYFSSNESAKLAADRDRVVISGSDIVSSAFPRQALIRALYSCGVRWLATLERLGRASEANHLRPFAAAAGAALAAAGLPSV
jgi:hypothetical protein